MNVAPGLQVRRSSFPCPVQARCSAVRISCGNGRGKHRVIPALAGEDSWGLPDTKAIGFDGVDSLELAMPIPLSPAYDASSLRAAARMSKDAGQTRRLMALAAIYDGATRTEAAVMGNVTVQI